MHYTAVKVKNREELASLLGMLKAQGFIWNDKTEIDIDDNLRFLLDDKIWVDKHRYYFDRCAIGYRHTKKYKEIFYVVVSERRDLNNYTLISFDTIMQTSNYTFDINAIDVKLGNSFNGFLTWVCYEENNLGRPFRDYCYLYNTPEGKEYAKKRFQAFLNAWNSAKIDALSTDDYYTEEV